MSDLELAVVKDVLMVLIQVLTPIVLGYVLVEGKKQLTKLQPLQQ